MKALPIIILNWNGTDDTIECIESLMNQTNTNFEIYLIDNYSEPEQLKKLEQYILDKERINFSKNNKNLGFVGAHNIILKNFVETGKYEYVFLLNNDTTVNENFVEAIHESIKKYPNAGMVSSKMINYDNRDTINNLGHKMINTGEILPIANNRQEKKYNKPFKNVGASGGGALYSIKMLQDIGIFDSYFKTGYEDAELGIRAMIAGYELICDPCIIIYHKVGASVNKIRDYDYTLKIQLDILYTYYKLMPVFVIIVNIPFYITRTLFLLLLFLFSIRLKYFNIFFKGWRIFLFNEFKHVKEQRRKISKIRRLNSIGILIRQDFFLIDNIKRFWIYFIKKEKTIFERYS